MLPILSGTGRLTQDVELRFGKTGTAVATISLAFNDRKRDEQGNWVDGDTFYIRGTAFKQMAEGAAETLSRGMEVVVTGRLVTDQWQDKQTGDKRSAPSLLISSIGPNLAFATATVNRVDRSHAGGSETGGNRQPAYAAGSSSDPWGAGPDTPSTADDQPPF
jgi:single-strand DNA-binding protein